MLAAALPESLAVDLADARSLKARAAAGDKESLAGAARQFEALMIAQMLKTLRETRFSSEDDPLDGGESMKLYRGLLDQQWATSMAKGRGLGFADMLVKHLERQAGIPAPTTAGHPAPTGEGGSSSAAPAAVSGAAPTAPPALSGDWQRRPADAAPAWQKTVPAAAGQETVAPPQDAAERKQRFLDSLRPHAEAAQQTTGVPARFILAQAALESGWGAREIKDGEGRTSHNLFGIKAGKSWDGAAVETTTTEYRGGLATKLTQRFRSYADYAAAFSDYANLLKARYADALAAGQDAAGFADGLAAGGYATDPAYAGKLKAVIASVANAGL
ncbi:MAG: flagellar assembly peptidoglycan hydrolase FlgJ [Pseudomonadota bacterium]